MVTSQVSLLEKTNRNQLPDEQLAEFNAKITRLERLIRDLCSRLHSVLSWKLEYKVYVIVVKVEYY